jgi:hypothetical protein
MFLDMFKLSIRYNIITNKSCLMWHSCVFLYKYIKSQLILVIVLAVD